MGHLIPRLLFSWKTKSLAVEQNVSTGLGLVTCRLFGRSSEAESPSAGLRPRGQYAAMRRRSSGPARWALANQVRSGRKQP